MFEEEECSRQVFVEGELSLGAIDFGGKTGSEAVTDALSDPSIPEEMVRSVRSGGNNDLLLRMIGGRVELSLCAPSVDEDAPGDGLTEFFGFKAFTLLIDDVAIPGLFLGGLGGRADWSDCCNIESVDMIRKVQPIR